jgi:hypothetical protein
MKFKKLLILGLLCVSQSIVFAGIEDNVSVSGAYLGGYNYLAQKSNVRAQFDYAVNIDFNLTLSEKLSGIVQLQTGPGNGSLGYQGPVSVLTDLGLSYEIDENTILTFGSFDTPFGDETGRLTNNADSFNQPFLLNNLLYSSFAGPVGTLNTLGLMLEKSMGRLTTTISLTNGTGETAVNEGNTFEAVARESFAINDELQLSLSGMLSRDSDEAGNDDTNGFGVDFKSYLAEIYFNNGSVFIGSSYGWLDFDDNDASTSDFVTFYSIQAGKIVDKLTVATRVSNWAPDDSNLLSAGISNVGLGISHDSYTVNNESDSIRYQLGLSYLLTETFTVNTEIVVDDYKNELNEDVTGLISYVNVGF